MCRRSPAGLLGAWPSGADGGDSRQSPVPAACGSSGIAGASIPDGGRLTAAAALEAFESVGTAGAGAVDGVWSAAAVIWVLKFRDSLTEMDSRFRGNDVISARCVTFTLAVIPAYWPSFPRKRESIV